MNCDPKALLAAAKCYQCVPKAVWGPTVISLLCEWSNNMAKCTFQSGAGSPVGVAVPKFIGQLYHDTTSGEYWRSTGLTNADWVIIGGSPFVEWLPHTEVATWDDAGGAGQVGDYTTFLANADLHSLSSLNLDATAITSLVCNFCPVLTNLRASSCTGPLTVLNVNGCYALVSLVCNLNSIASLDISTNVAINNLDCSTNLLTSLDISNHLAIETVSCAYNAAMTTLDASNCIALVNLACGYCALTSLNVTGSAFISTLFAFYNQLTTLDVSTLTVLNTLNIDNNLLDPANVDNVLCDVDANGQLNGVLVITNNSIPTAAGLVCSANLDPGKGWTVTHD